MVARKALPTSDHIMRFVPYSAQHRDDDDSLIGLTKAAMTLRVDDDGGLSVTWIEYFGPFGLPSIRLGAMAYRQSQSSKRIGPKGVFASAQIATVLAAGESFQKKLRVVHDPVDDNPGHAEVRQFDDEDQRLLDLLTMEVFVSLIEVSSLGLPKPAP